MRPLAVDVLILGAGLAGLRAALSNLTAAPGLSVLVVSLRDAPTGSSFANQNDALGIHACASDAERQDYVREALTLNRGAVLDRKLLAVQAEEGWDRLMDMVDLGLDFTRDASGRLLAHSSCFSPGSRRAYVFSGLSQAYQAFRRRLNALGGRFLSGYLPVALLPGGALLLPDDHISRRNGGPAGGLNSGCASRRDARPAVGHAAGPPIAVGAKATIVALGGPGRLFGHSMAGPGVPGYSHGLLAQAGVRLANTRFLQWMWGTVPGHAFWQPASLAEGGYRVRTLAGDIPFEDVLAGLDDPSLPGGLPGATGAEGAPGLSGPTGPVGTTGLAGPADQADTIPLAELAASRIGHCPFGYGLPDAALDLALARHLDADGIVRLLTPEGVPLAVAPMAHATNGGAVINVWGETNVPGLLACGECATGMHGSNRLGGGMILASQVFGHRAGLRAAQLADGGTEPDDVYAIAGEILEGLQIDTEERRMGLSALGLGLSRFAALGGRPGHAAYMEHLRQQMPRDWLLAACRDTALEILSGLPYPG